MGALGVGQQALARARCSVAPSASRSRARRRARHEDVVDGARGPRDDVAGVLLGVAAGAHRGGARLGHAGARRRPGPRRGSRRRRARRRRRGPPPPGDRSPAGGTSRSWSCRSVIARRRYPGPPRDRARRRPRAPTYPPSSDGRAPLRPAGDRAALAARVGRRAHLGGLQRRPDGAATTLLRAGDAALPERRAAHRPPEELRASATRSRTSTAASAAACCTRWATTRSACRPRTTRSRPAQHPRDSTDDVDRVLPAPVPRVGHLDRLVARVRHARAALLPLDAVDLPAALRARPRLPQGGGRQVVPERPDRARQRAGRSTAAASAAAPMVEVAPARAVVLPHHRLRRPPARRPRRRSSGPSTSRRCSATGSAAPRAPRSTFRCEELGIDYPVFTTRPDTLFGATFFVMAPEHPDVLRARRGHRARGRRCATTSTTR